METEFGQNKQYEKKLTFQRALKNLFLFNF